MFIYLPSDSVQLSLTLVFDEGPTSLKRESHLTNWILDMKSNNKYNNITQ